MKTLVNFLVVFCFLSLSAQEKGSIKGQITGMKSGEVIPFANITLSHAKHSSKSTTSNFNGTYQINQLDTGLWDIHVAYVGYQSKKINGIEIKPGEIVVLDITIDQGASLSEVVIVGYKRPLFEMDQTTIGQTITRSEIRNMPGRSVNDIAKTAGNATFSRDNASYIRSRGGRTSNSVIFVDGVKVIGSKQLPSSAIKEVKVYEKGVPARFENLMVMQEEGLPRESAVRNRNIRKRVKKKDKEVVLDFAEPEEVLVYENELYQEIADNPFESPKKTPLSTFSIDVDRAAYANVRRFLTQGRMPPVNAVRVEEMINYFDYDYPEPEGEHPFSISTELSECPWNSERKLALIGIQGKKVDLEQAPNSNLVFLIDVSGSMNSYDKLDLVKKGLGLLIDEMRPEDRLAIVVYAGAAGVVLESSLGTEKRKIKSALNQLSAGGSTAGGAGIHLAYQIAQDHFIEGGNNRVILATDGDFNVGTSGQEALVKLIEKKRNTGVFLSVLGLGSGNLQDYKMEQLANKGNGNYNYLDNILEAKKVLVKEMGGTLFTIAKDVKVQAEFNPAKVKAYRLIGYVNRALADEDFNDDRKDAGELGSGHSVTVLYEIIPVGSSEKIMDIDSLKYQLVADTKVPYSDEILTVKFRYKQPDGKVSSLITQAMKNQTVSLDNASQNLRFSASVAGFGMKLRKSESVENFSFSELNIIARTGKGIDENGYRSEFIKLIETAELLAKK